MKKNPGRKDRRKEARKNKKHGDNNRNSQHKMKTHAGMRKVEG